MRHTRLADWQVIFMASIMICCDFLNMEDFHPKPIICSWEIM